MTTAADLWKAANLCECTNLSTSGDRCGECPGCICAGTIMAKIADLPTGTPDPINPRPGTYTFCAMGGLTYETDENGTVKNVTVAVLDGFDLAETVGLTDDENDEHVTVMVRAAALQWRLPFDVPENLTWE